MMPTQFATYRCLGESITIKTTGRNSSPLLPVGLVETRSTKRRQKKNETRNRTWQAAPELQQNCGCLSPSPSRRALSHSQRRDQDSSYHSVLRRDAPGDSTCKRDSV